MSDTLDATEAGFDGISEVADFVQARRVLKVESPLGPDVLLPERATITEGVSELFTIELSVRAKREQVKPEELIGRLVDVRLEVEQGGEESDGDQAALRRPFNGLVTALGEGPPITRGLRSYTLTLRPQLWLLSRRSDCRIFMDRTVLDICETLLAEHGLPPADFSGVILKPPAQHYSVQWNESDLDYLTRRLEEDGLFFWFEHEEGRHRMIVGDHQSAWRGPSAAARGEARVRIAQGSADRNHIDDWGRRFAYVPGARTGADWNFETPGTVPRATTPSAVELPDNARRELYEYPSRASDVAGNERAERLRMQSSEADHDRVDGASSVRVLEPGRRFLPFEVAHPERPYEEHVVVRAVHRIVDRSYEAAVDEPEYRNEFEATPARVALTPHRGAHRPKIAGAQVGIVAGPAGEEIHCDKYGRVKLWFPWDRRAKKDGSDTCWVRVSQPWAGGNWGAQVIPRIGMEAMIAYVDGDPDRPLVTGLVPNPHRAVPYDLPANKSRMTLRSDTHKGSGFNEMSFEDEAGQENMFFHAQKDQTTRVLNNRTKRVDANEVSSIGGNRAVEVAANQKHEVGGSMNLTVGGTGAAALGLMAQVSGLAGQTAGLLSQAGQIAGGGAAAALPALASFTTTLASSTLGFLGAGGLSAREGVVAGASPRSDAGTALAGAGAGVGGAAQSLFPLSGIMNTVVGNFKSDTVGIASVEQVGVSKVTNIGSTSMESVGKFKKLTVGEEFVVEVGASMLIMRKDGTVILLGTNFNFTASGPVQINGSVVDLNKPGS